MSTLYLVEVSSRLTSTTSIRPLPAYARLAGGWISFPDGTFQWTTPSGRQCTTEPTRYPF